MSKKMRELKSLERKAQRAYNKGTGTLAAAQEASREVHRFRFLTAIRTRQMASNTTTVFTAPDGSTAYQFHFSKGCYSGKTSLSIAEVKAAVKGIDLPTSRQRAKARHAAVKSAELAKETPQG